MNNRDGNRSFDRIAAAERAHKRATGHDGLGDVEIYILLRDCNIRMSERATRLLEPAGITLVGYITMMVLYSRPENSANPSELSDATGETRGNMTRICDELVDKRWVQRVTNGDDRRRVDLSLTPDGIELLQSLIPVLRRNADEFYARTFTEIEKTALRQLLIKFSAGLAVITEPLGTD